MYFGKAVASSTCMVVISVQIRALIKQQESLTSGIRVMPSPSASVHSLIKCLIKCIIPSPQGKNGECIQVWGDKMHCRQWSSLWWDQFQGVLVDSTVDWASIIFMALRRCFRRMETDIPYRQQIVALYSPPHTVSSWKTDGGDLHVELEGHKCFGNYKVQVVPNVGSWLPNASPSVLWGQ